MTDCPVCESENYNETTDECPDCGHYDEYKAKHKQDRHRRDDRRVRRSRNRY